MRYTFPWNGQQRKFEAQITPNTNVIQLKNFFATCNKGLNGIFEQPNIASIHAFIDGRCKSRYVLRVSSCP